jgi:hypothetical protein
MKQRIIDVKGHIIVPPALYEETKELACTMLDKMEEANVDRSDMCVVLHCLLQELNFHLLFLLGDSKKQPTSKEKP